MKTLRDVLARLRDWAGGVKHKTYAVYLACSDPRVPWYAKALGAMIVAYAFSPVDLIPDFIPILGYLDDLILLPLGIAAVIKMIPEQVMEDCLRKARSEMSKSTRKNWIAGTIVLLIWGFVAAVAIRYVVRKVLSLQSPES